LPTEEFSVAPDLFEKLEADQIIFLERVLNNLLAEQIAERPFGDH
jgi:hypothetical protein